MPPPSKRHRDGDEGTATASQQSAAKRPRHGLPVDPANLPDGPWKRKLTKVRKEIFHHKKVEKQYARIKARHVRETEGQNKVATGDDLHVHPDRRAMTTGGGQDAAGEAAAGQAITEQPVTAAKSKSSEATAAEAAAPNNGDGDDYGDQTQAPPRRRPQGKPVYFQREMAEAEERKRVIAEREAQARAREEDRARKMAERDRLRKAMAKVRKPSSAPGGSGGRVKLGRESNILLDKVKKMVGQNR